MTKGKEVIQPKGVFNPQEVKDLDPRGLPWSQCVRVGNLLFISGQVSRNRENNLIGEGDIVKQTEQTFENLKAILEELGGSLDDVVHTNWYCTNIEDFYKKGCSNIRWKYYKKDFPTSTLIGVTRLSRPFLMVELQAIALVS
jgi:2-iminobutanoate/2-iminopropanoate deaminase